MLVSDFATGGGNYQPTLYLRASIFNNYGQSAERDYHPTTVAGQWNTPAEMSSVVAGTTGGVTGDGSVDGGTGGGEIGGGGCPAPWVQITLASGLTLAAGSLVDGMEVLGVNEATMEPAMGTVREPTMTWVDRVRVVLEDGRAPEFTNTHRVAVVPATWKEVRNLLPGDLLVAQCPSRVVRVESAGKGQVVSFSVEGCHTYFSDDILSHNLKISTI
jgi:hypothetical protein